MIHFMRIFYIDVADLKCEKVPAYMEGILEVMGPAKKTKRNAETDEIEFIEDFFIPVRDRPTSVVVFDLKEGRIFKT